MPGTDFLGTGFGEEVTHHRRPHQHDRRTTAFRGRRSSSVPTVRDADERRPAGQVGADTSGLKEPNGELLPDIRIMEAQAGGPSASIKDLFVEVGFMTTAGYNIAGGQGPVTAHSHRPTPAALKMIGDALWCAGVVPCDASVLNPSNRVRVHFDVGTAYPSYEGGDPTDDYAERYIIRRAALAKGGESIPETVCAPPQDCQFPAYPGTVSWKTGFDLHRDAPVGPDGEALTLEEEADAASRLPGSGLPR